MTSVVTVSSVTASYAAEPVRPAARVTGTSFMEESLEAFTRKASQTDDPRQKVILNVVRPPALALFFLTAEGIGRNPEVSVSHVEEQYRSTMEMATGPASDSQADPGVDQGAAPAAGTPAPVPVVVAEVKAAAPAPAPDVALAPAPASDV